MKKFYVSKSDQKRVAFIQNAIQEIKPSTIFILVEKDRENVYEGIEAVKLPLKELNKTEEWITFTNTFSKDSLLIIDNVLKFIFFGDGKKKYLKDVSQSINNIIVTDVVPFYTEPHEIFYPFWFLGKEILGYNSYQSFKANHLEEKTDGSIDYAHSFSVLQEKIKDYYVQDYSSFWNDRKLIKWEMTEESLLRYANKKKTALDKYNNPIRMKTAFADFVNLLEEKAAAIKEEIKGKCCLVINYMPYEKKIRKFFSNENFDVISYHEKDKEKFLQYDTVIFYDNIIVKPHSLFYIEPLLEGKQIINLIECSTGIDQSLYNAVYDIGLRDSFDNYFSYDKKD